MTEAEARATGRSVLVGKRMVARVGRARELSETQDFMKVLVAIDTGSILGAAILGWYGDELIHCLLDVMYTDKPYTVSRQAVQFTQQSRRSYKPF